MDPFQSLFLSSLKGPLVDLLDLRGEALASLQIDQTPLQDSFRFQAKHLGLKVAYLLIDEKGELNEGRLEELKRQFVPYVLGPHRENDAILYGHIARCLEGMREAWPWIKKFSIPLCHKGAEDLVRKTVGSKGVQTVDVRRAVVAAWFTLLRQATGSCFATAPALLVQQMQPGRFFKDLLDLLSTGQMKRVVGGKEYAVPLNLQMVKGDLQKISPWLDSAGVRWALESVGVSVSLEGMEPQSVERALKTVLLKQLGLTEEDVKEEEYLAQIQMAPLLAKQSAVYYQRPSERGQKVAEWKKRVARACEVFVGVTECPLLRAWEYSIASFCDVKTEFGRWNLFIGLGLHPDQKGGVGALLYEVIDQKLQQTNREIERLTGEYEGAVGTLQALESMMKGAASEARIQQLKGEWMNQSLKVSSVLEERNRAVRKAEGLAQFFPHLIEQYDRHLQESFQELFDPTLSEGEVYEDSPAGFRLYYKHARKDATQWTAIQNGDQYIECLTDFFRRIEREIESEWIEEVTTFLLQRIREASFLQGAMQRAKEAGRLSPWDYISGGTLQTLLMAYCNRDRAFTEDQVVPQSAEQLLEFLRRFKRGPLLMHSPTHAFIFYPEWLSKQREIERRALDESMQEYLLHKISERLPEEERALFIHRNRQKQVNEWPNRPEVASVLYEQTPLLNREEAELSLREIARRLGVVGQIRLEETFYGPIDLVQKMKEILLNSLKNPLSTEDWDRKIAEAMVELGLKEAPLLFGDTNWSGWFLGFVTNPLTQRLELWRLNRTATRGSLMVDWLNSDNTQAWVVLSQNSEYFF